MKKKKKYIFSDLLAPDNFEANQELKLLNKPKRKKKNK